MGEVYRAVDRHLGDVVALKAFRAATAGDRERFEREARTLGRLRHEGIVRLHDAGATGRDVFFTMELLHGVGLEAFLSRPPPDAGEIAWSVMVALKLVDALEHVHDRGLVHRDLKPSNVMVLLPSDTSASERGAAVDAALRESDPRVKLLDFGLTVEREAALRAGQGAGGTLLYMSPEQLQNAPVLDGRSDLYSLGALLYHFVTRRPPFLTLVDALSRRQRPPPPCELNAACPEALSRTILALLETVPHRRPANAAELRRPLLSFLDDRRQESATRPHLLPPAFTGRTAELDTLRDLVRIQNGRGSCVRIVGERGSGKTWILRQSGFLNELVFDHGMTCVQGSFAPGGLPHQGLRNVLEALLETATATTAAAAGDGAGGEGGSAGGEGSALGPAVEVLRRGLGLGAPGGGASEPTPAGERRGAGEGSSWLLSPAPSQEEILEASVRVVREAVRRTPIIVVFEDLQHADSLELALITRWVRILDDTPIVILVTYRTAAAAPSPGASASEANSEAMGSLAGEAGASGPWRPDPARLDRWVEVVDAAGFPPPISLGCLSDRESRQLVEGMLRPAGVVSDGLFLALAARSAGRPLGLIRCLQLLWERGDLRFEDSSWKLVERAGGAAAGGAAAGGPAPGGAALDGKSLWLERLAALETGERRALAAAVILGAPFEEEFLASVLGVTAPELPPALRSLVHRGFLVESAEGFAATQDLDEDALGAVVPAALLQDLHGRAAVRLRERYGDLENQHFRIAVHLQRAGDSEAASGYYLSAARHAARIYANWRGIEAFQRAIDLSTDPARRRDAARELGDLYSRIGDYRAALRELRFARSINDEILAAARRSGSEAPGDLLAAEFHLLDGIGRILQRQGEFADALETFSLALQRGGSTPGVRARCLFRIGGVHLEQGDLPAAERCLQESLRTYEEIGDFGEITEVESHLGLLAKSQDRLDLAVHRFERALGNAYKSGRLPQIATTLNNLGNLHRARGDDGRAIDCLQRSIAARERSGDRQGLAICLNNIAQVFSYRGEFRAARASTERALRIFEEIGDPKGLVIARANLGELSHSLGELHTARRLLNESLEQADRCGMHRLLEMGLHYLGSLETDCGNYAEAEPLLLKCLRTLPPQPSELRAMTLGALAAVRIRLEEFELAEDALREAMHTASELRLREKLGILVGYEVRFHVERGCPERAIESAATLRGEGRPRMEAMAGAVLSREIGRAYRELGPEWADQTEKHLSAALSEFERMESPHNLAETQAELAVYWRLLGEEAGAEDLFRAAQRNLRSVQAPRRLEELMALWRTP
jgi:tetratricopeptide (TPR) repeat protein